LVLANRRIARFKAAIASASPQAPHQGGDNAINARMPADPFLRSLPDLAGATCWFRTQTLASLSDTSGPTQLSVMAPLGKRPR
jgi:hypothetical protein